MQVLYTILYILLFIFCLSVLVLIHELGHFSVAKFFKVYIHEFSIGFGPALIHKKRKNGETYFSLRGIPFGGYVAMYEKGVTLPDGIVVDDSRSFTNLRKWKKILILFAGVFNNAILALILFFISNSCFIQKAMYLSYVEVAKDSIAATAGIVTDDYISVRPTISYDDKQKKEVTVSNVYTVDKVATITYSDDSKKEAYAILLAANATYTERSYDTTLKFYQKDDLGYPVLGDEIKADATIKNVSYTVTTALSTFKQYRSGAWVDIPSIKIEHPQVNDVYRDKELRSLMKWNGTEWVKTGVDQIGYLTPESPTEYFIWQDTEGVKTEHLLTLNSVNKEGNYSFESSGLSFFYEEYWNDFGASIRNTFVDFGNSSTIIVRSLASLFTSAETWQEVGGIVAIGVQTTNILQNFGLGKFIYIWGLISVNLAIVNLLPFPGLDGWQILVLVVEGVFRKEIPEKVKNIVSFIGIALLMALMVMILIKDVIGLF